MLTVPIEENNVEIIVNPLPTVTADESQMMQLIQNLIGNSIKFHGLERLLIRISSSQGAKEWTFSVEDNEFVATCAEFPALSWLADSQGVALQGLVDVVADTVDDLVSRGEVIPRRPFLPSLGIHTRPRGVTFSLGGWRTGPDRT